jgi:hypothetical protein
MPDNLFTQVKNSIRAQKSSFCSRSTKITPLETLGSEELILYTDCNGRIVEIRYGDITITGGYIPDCVQGGCSITAENNIKLFVQYGTTDCNTPPPPPTGPNLIITSCSRGESFVIDPSGLTLYKDRVYNLSFNNIVISNGCYTIGNTTSQSPIDSLKNDPGPSYEICGQCP